MLISRNLFTKNRKSRWTIRKD